MKLYLLTVFSACVACVFGGRAFTIEAENHARELFASVNPNIGWDWTNFIVDLSGPYASCPFVGQDGYFATDVRTRDGLGIVGIRGSGISAEYHVNAMNEAIPQIIDTWPSVSQYRDVISKATRFGCSVQPGCRNDVVLVACLFSGVGLDGGVSPEEGEPRARAFTEDQYKIAESITGREWDNTRFLENLSGYDIGCGMVAASSWDFKHANRIAKERGLDVRATYGADRNPGNTEAGMKEVLKYMSKPAGAKVGCSLKPDCIHNGEEWVVISCLYLVE